MDSECEECRAKRLSMQRSSIKQSSSSAAPCIVYDVLRSLGQPLDTSTKSFMEPRFGHDFSNVRVHTDTKAAESARSVNALAYTVGSDVVFGTGQYTPGTITGKKLLAHELTHVVQQHTGLLQGKLALSGVDKVSEKEADRVANEAVAVESGTIGWITSPPVTWVILPPSG